MEEEQIIKYGYYNDIGEYCVVLDSEVIKKKYNAQRIYLDTEE